jgi:predicted permease
MPVSACPFRSSQAVIDNRNARMVQAFGRMKAGTPPEQVSTDVAMVASKLQQGYPEAYPAASGYTAISLPLRGELTRAFRPTLMLLVGAAGFVLLIVSASVANLLLARLVRREREMAIRAALGAGRWRLFRQLLTESSVLALLGGIVGLALAAVSLDVLVAFADRFTTRSTEIGINGTVLLFTLAVAVGTGILVGIIPALPTRSNVSNAIQEGGRNAAGGRIRFRSALIVAQVAVSFVLLIGAGLMLRSFRQLQAVDAGIKTDSVLTMRVALNFTKYTNQGQIREFHAAVIEKLKQIPELRSVAAASTFPLNDSAGFVTALRVEGQGDVDASRLPRVEITSASPGYFQTVGIPLLKGRLFTDHDNADGQPTAIISESMAKHFFPDREPLGARVVTNNGQLALTIVGVVGDVRRTLDSAPSDALYRPLAQASPLTAMYLMRTSGSVNESLGRQAREALYSVDPNQPADQFRTLDQVRSQSVEAPRLTAILMGLFAMLAVAITAAGLGGVIAFSVNQRTQEFGVRMALGATRGSLLRMVLGHAVMLVGIGLAIGIVVALVSGRVVKTLLFNVTTTDAITYATVAVAFLVIAILACAVPARRAASVDPMIALRGN